MHKISKDFEFSASHQLAGLPAEHPCSRLHGHNYTVRLSLTGDLNEIGFVHDYRALAPFKAWLDDTLDHRHLNEILDGNPTAERMSRIMANKALELLALPDRVHVVTVAVSETPKTWAEYSVHIVSENDSERYRWAGEGK